MAFDLASWELTQSLNELFSESSFSEASWEPEVDGEVDAVVVAVGKPKAPAVGFGRAAMGGTTSGLAGRVVDGRVALASCGTAPNLRPLNNPAPAGGAPSARACRALDLLPFRATAILRCEMSTFLEEVSSSSSSSMSSYSSSSLVSKSTVSRVT